jgi:hypothetical protein
MTNHPRQHRSAWAWLGVCGLVVVGLGCNPGLFYFLTPWIDGDVPAEHRIATKSKETTVAIVCNLITPDPSERSEGIDIELATKLERQLKKRCADNREKIKFIANPTVRNQQMKLVANGAGVSPVELGKQVNADSVIVLDVNKMLLWQPRSNNMFYRGQAEITVSVFDMKQTEGQHKVYEKEYRIEFPKNGPIDAGSSSLGQFRGMFLERVAGDLSRMFTKYAPDQRYHVD